MIIDLLIAIIAIIVIVRLAIIFKDKISFFAEGNDKGFKFSESRALWRLAKEVGIEHPEELYHSLELVNQAISKFLTEIQNEGTETVGKNQDFLSKLYAYRTRISLEHENKKGLISTKYLAKGQKLRIVLPSKGLFASDVIGNGDELFIRIPKSKENPSIPDSDWVGQEISVYLWRKGDAGYVFDSFVFGTGLSVGVPVLKIRHSSNLLRTQKRKSIRVQCQIDAQLYFISGDDIDFQKIETEGGFRCVVEDLSEDGALIRVGGHGEKDIRIKLQFNLDDRLVCMFGVVRAVEFNKSLNQSRLHFECAHIEEPMRLQVLSFVYNILPEKQKAEVDALNQLEEEVEKDANAHAEAILDGAVAEATLPTVEEKNEHLDEQMKNLESKIASGGEH